MKHPFERSRYEGPPEASLMARSEARVHVTIWTDPDFTVLNQEDQRTYLFVMSQPGISLCGVLPLTFGRWAGMAADSTQEGLKASIDRLQCARFVVADFDTDELLVRSFIRHDGVWRNSKTRTAAISQRQHILSTKILAALDAEIDRARIIFGEDAPSGAAPRIEDAPSGAAPDKDSGAIPSQESPSPVSDSITDSDLLSPDSLSPGGRTIDDGTHARGGSVGNSCMDDRADPVGDAALAFAARQKEPATV